MENIEIRLNDSPSLGYTPKYYGEKVSIARSELLRLFGKPKNGKNCLYLNLEMAIDNGDSVTIVPFQLKIIKLGNTNFHDYSNCQILTTNKDFSQQIRDEFNNLILKQRNDIRERDRHHSIGSTPRDSEEIS